MVAAVGDVDVAVLVDGHAGRTAELTFSVAAGADRHQRFAAGLNFCTRSLRQSPT